VVVITHDDHYFEQANRIIKLDYGKIEFDGPVAAYLDHLGQPSPQAGRSTGHGTLAAESLGHAALLPMATGAAGPAISLQREHEAQS
jgi:energy-coupling factor transporter ATP-binding protein EcfA2